VDLRTISTKGLIGRPLVASLLPACWVAVLYYVAAEAAHLLAAAPVPLPFLRPGGAVLLAALLTQPARLWWVIVLAVVPAHVLAQLQHPAPLMATLPWLVSDCTQALLGAAGAMWFLRAPLRFDILRDVVVFAYWCGFIAPAFALGPELAVVGEARLPGEFAVRLFGNAALVLTLVPPWVILRSASGGAGRAPLLNGQLASGAVGLLFTVVVVAATAAGNGVFAGTARSGGTLLLPVMLAAVAVPALLASAALAERRGTLAALQREQQLLGQALASERKRAERLARERRARGEVEQQVAARTVELRQANQRLRAEAAARKQALEAELAAAERFTRLFRLSPDAMAISACADGPLLDVNERWQALFGYARDEVLGKCAMELGLFPAPPQLSTRETEVRMRDRHGNLLQVVVSGAIIETGGDRCCLAIMRDVTAQRRAEAEVQRQREQLTHLTRVLALGELSGALAHELNQPLAAILANAQAARRCLARPGADLASIRAILDDIVDDDQRAGAVIRRLRALFRNEAPALQPVVVDALVRETLDLAHGCLSERNVQVLLELRNRLVVLGDRVQLQQVLLNLLLNASDAMQATPPGRRRLRLASTALPDGTVQLTVADSGPGIARDALGKVFDPLFTTKKTGLGVGLSISRAIISQHGGKIEAINNPAGGCTFRVRLPAHVEVPDER
jgi:two-component system, LuxR family, sensor kinase FixL